ncbi:hypothetical protein KP509_18G026200 [Ceratopteris richardii]|uniref:F-box domain-containing protein n=1 Tax=Ceratopteris richardii TaxID=49495 RepID=A0A8T2SRH4_CERRI|nr:hypothetical protein KP509_18G026200 [Ceratopteris richardii]
MDMPNDIVEAIFLRLSVFDIARARAVCKFWNRVLCNREFLVRHGESNNDDSVALFSHNLTARKKNISLYSDASSSWRPVSLDFVPSEFTDMIAADGGLLCIGGHFHGDYIVCVCNPVSKTYKILPRIDSIPYFPSAAMVTKKHKIDGECSYKIAILLLDAVAVISSSSSTWVKFKSVRPSFRKSPVMCNGVLYSLHHIRSPWRSNWRLVYTKLDNPFCREAWCELNHRNGGGIIDILHQPCLLESRGCLLLVGGLRHLRTTDLRVALIILKLDLTTLEWCEAARMPDELYRQFDSKEDFSICSHNGNVYFLNKSSSALVVCKFLNVEDGGVWQWIEDCPLRSSSNIPFLSKAFALKLSHGWIS